MPITAVTPRMPPKYHFLFSSPGPTIKKASSENSARGSKLMISCSMGLYLSVPVTVTK